MSANPEDTLPAPTMEEYRESSTLAGGNAVWLEDQYERFLDDPNSVDESWRAYFRALPMIDENARDVPHAPVRAQFRRLTGAAGGRAYRPGAGGRLGRHGSPSSSRSTSRG